MTSDEWSCFWFGVIAILVVIGITSLCYIEGGRGKIYDLKHDIKLCGADRIECYQKVLEMRKE